MFKGKTVIVQLLIFALYMTMLSPYPVQAAEAEKIPGYFADHFDKMKINDTWNAIEGPWSIDAGKLSVAKGQGYKAISNKDDMNDFTIESDIRVADRNGDAGLLFRTVSATPGADNVRGYYAGLSAAGTGAVMLGRMSNNWTELKRSAVTINPNTDYRLKVSAVGSQINIYVNDVLVLQQTDSTYTQGSVGVRMYNSMPSYDNIVVKSVGGDTLLSDNFDTPAEQAIEHWNLVDGSWKLQSGAITVNKGDGYKNTCSRRRIPRYDAGKRH